MATSTFFTKLTIDKKAAEILIKGFEGAKLPPPVTTTKVLEGDELERYFSNLKRSSETV